MSKSAIFMQKNLVISKNSSTFAVRNDERLVFARKSGFSSVGRVHVWGARGRWFESSNPDIKRKGISLSFFVSFTLAFPSSAMFMERKRDVLPQLLQKKWRSTSSVGML